MTKRLLVGLGVLIGVAWVAAFVLEQTGRRRYNGYWECDCVGVVARPDATIEVGGAVSDNGRCWGFAVDCQRCCRCF